MLTPALTRHTYQGDLQTVTFELGTDRESLGGVHLDHPLEKVLAIWWDEVWHVENAQLHLFQQIPQVIIVERQRPLERWRGRVQSETQKKARNRSSYEKRRNK